MIEAKREKVESIFLCKPRETLVFQGERAVENLSLLSFFMAKSQLTQLFALKNLSLLSFLWLGNLSL